MAEDSRKAATRTAVPEARASFTEGEQDAGETEHCLQREREFLSGALN